MSARKWTDEHGEDGLRRKFDVYKPKDEVSDFVYASYRGGNAEIDDAAIYYKQDRLGADGEFIFVLRPETDETAWWALMLYANQSDVQSRSPQLAEDIRRELRRIRDENS